MDIGRWALATRATTAPCGPGQCRCVASGTPHSLDLATRGAREPRRSRIACDALPAALLLRCPCCVRCRCPLKRCFPHYGQSHPALAADAPGFWQVASWTPTGGFESHIDRSRGNSCRRPTRRPEPDRVCEKVRSFQVGVVSPHAPTLD